MVIIKKTPADLLFWSHIVVSVIFTVSQTVRMLHSTQGVSTSMFLFAEFFVGINFVLAFSAHKIQPSRITAQTMIINAVGVFLYFLFLSVVFIKGTGVWDINDNVTTILAGSGSLVTILIALRKKLGIADPMVKAWLALIMKSIPQLFLAYKIWNVGGAGLSGLFIATFHFLTLLRLSQIGLSIREAGWDRNRKGLFLSDLGNEISWIAVTFAWIYKI